MAVTPNFKDLMEKVQKLESQLTNVGCEHPDKLIEFRQILSHEKGVLAAYQKVCTKCEQVLLETKSELAANILRAEHCRKLQDHYGQEARTYERLTDEATV